MAARSVPVCTFCRKSAESGSKVIQTSEMGEVCNKIKSKSTYCNLPGKKCTITSLVVSSSSDDKLTAERHTIVSAKKNTSFKYD